MAFDIIGVSRTRKFNIGIISAAVFGALFFIIGLALAAGGSTGTSAKVITVSASGIYLDPSGSGNYRLNSYALQTPITVDTAPYNQTSTPVRFTIINGSDCAEITRSIKSGNSAIFKLKKRNNMYAFGEEVTIDISCGTAPVRTLIVKICVPDNEVEFDFTNALRRDGVSTGGNVISEDVYRRAVQTHTYPYTFRPTLKIWGETISAVYGKVDIWWYSDCSEQDLKTYSNGSVRDTFFGWYNSLDDTVQIPSTFVTVGAVYTFDITAQIAIRGGGTYTCTGRYTLRIGI